MIKILFSLLGVGLNTIGLLSALIAKNIAFGIWCAIWLYWFIWMFMKAMDLYLEKY